MVSDQRPVVGHIRFSFYGLTDTRLRPDPDGAALARLYDETRIARRFHLFETLTLPSLRAQTDRNFSLVVLSSDLMHDRFKDRLVRLMQPFPRAVVDFSAEREGRLALKPHMERFAAASPTGMALHFRLDDDDAVASTYVRRLRLFSAGRRPGTHVTFPTGILLFPAAAGSGLGLAKVIRVFLTGAGLAVISGPKHPKKPFEMQHLRVWQTAPVASDPEIPAYIRSFHFDNDTVLRHNRILRQMREDCTGPEAATFAAEVDRALARGFPFIDRARLTGLVGELAAIRSLDDLPPPP